MEDQDKVEAALEYIKTQFPHNEFAKEQLKLAFIAGAKWMNESIFSYNKDLLIDGDK